MLADGAISLHSRPNGMDPPDRQHDQGESIMRISSAVGALVVCAGTVALAQTTARDSAGIRIVVTSAANAPRWTVAPAAERSIGTASGGAAYELNGVTYAYRLTDGRVAVVNGGDEVRYYDAAGRYIKTFGRSGSGPGEFRRITNTVRTAGDSLLIWDWTLKRLTLVTPAGTLGREQPALRYPGMSASGIAVLGPLSGGRVAMTKDIPYPMGQPTGYYRESLVVVTTRLDGTRSDTAAYLPHTEWFIQAANPPAPNRTGPGSTHPFGYTAFARVWNDGIVTGRGEQYELRVYDGTARLRTIIRRSDTPRVPFAAAFESYMRAVRAVDGPDGLDRYREKLNQFPGPRFVPAFAGSIVDDVGCLWVRDFPSPDPPTAGRPQTWTVFAADGHVLAKVTMPVGLTVFSITERYIVGRVRDSLDVESVRVHRLDRAAAR
jgi:hypothetical protein